MKGKGIITEADTGVLLNRYSATTVLALLHEISRHANAKINWNYLIKHTATGITNAREYQMLWRHLAYRKELSDGYEEDAQPLEDDSDLEFEIESSPAVGPDALAEAAACVKVLASSGTSNDSSQPGQSTVEAPLTINVPSSIKALDMQENQKQASGMNITVPVSIQKQQIPTVSCSEGIEGNASTNSSHPVRKKRKLWTLEEDNELIAAVQKCGEGNWSSILKGAFKHDRTASQLSQRWSLIRRRQQVNSGTANPAVRTVDLPTSSRQATMNPPAANSQLKTGFTPHNTCGQPFPSIGMAPNTTQVAVGTLTGKSVSHVHPTSQAQDKVVTGNAGSSNANQPLPARKPRQPAKKQAKKAAVSLPSTTALGKHHASVIASHPVTTEGVSHGISLASTGPHPMVQAAAVAAGARIAPASAAASILKAAQSGNVVHIGPGISLTKHASQSANTSGATHTVGSSVGSVNGRASNVHYIQTGSGQLPSTSSGLLSGGQVLPVNHLKNQTGKSSASSQALTHSCRPIPSPMPLAATQTYGNTVTSSTHLLKGSIPDVTKKVKQEVVSPANLETNLALNALTAESTLPAHKQPISGDNMLPVTNERVTLSTTVSSAVPKSEEASTGAAKTTLTPILSSPATGADNGISVHLHKNIDVKPVDLSTANDDHEHGKSPKGNDPCEKDKGNESGKVESKLSP
eukprot:TRINITY_DN23198_c0_g1_i1.p1 TRINITY_DN23198_c0_g1~~TRINITY_DN23198_c0_g1_i1.p1  ORF type:complete len:692 (+),score=176.88 TRINITY_DN23198_c0_g1_i1:179-2254(+)